MSSISDLIRAAGWRQGAFVRRTNAKELFAASVDQIPPSVEEPSLLAVVTQDCDLVREPVVEPFVELILCREVARVERLYQNGRNPRLLHIQSIGPHGPGSWLEISIHDRFRIRKEKLCSFTADRCNRLERQDVRLLSRWIARRYTRPAFPDTFNRRLETVDSRLERLFKSSEGHVVTDIFLDVADEEYASERSYDIAVRLTAKAEVWDDDGLLSAVQNFEDRFIRLLDECDGISVSDIQALPEDHLTLADLRQYKRLDKDYRSLPEKEDVERSVDEGGEL